METLRKFFSSVQFKRLSKAVIASGIIFLTTMISAPTLLALFSELKNNSIFTMSRTIFLLDLAAVMLMLFLGIFYSVFNIEKLAAAFRQEHSHMDYLYGIVIAASVSIMFNPLGSGVKMSSFDRQIGYGVIRNHNSDKLVRNFFLWIFLIMALAVCFTLAISYIRKRFSGKYHQEAFAFLDNFMIIAAVNLVFRYITIFQDNSNKRFTFFYTFALINLIITAVLLYIIFIGNKTEFELFFQLHISVLAAAIPVSVMLKTEWNSGMLVFGIQSILTAVLITALSLFNIKPAVKRIIPWAALYASVLPLCLSAYIEGVNILNQYSVFITSLRSVFVCVLTAVFIIISVLYLFFRKSDRASEICRSLIYPLLIAGFTALSVQIPLSSTYNADIFETANSSILITDFLNFGKIPLVEHYGGHMMTNVWEGIIYGILNSDNYGAAFSPYAGYANILKAIGLFYLLKMILDKKTAFFSVLFLPLLNFCGYWCMGSFVIVAIAAYINKNTYFRAAMVWLSFVWCVQYRLDLGTSFVIAGLMILLIFILSSKNTAAAKQLAVTFLGYAVFFGGLWFAICLIKGIDPVSRLIEFIKISASNLNWARDTIGDSSLSLYSFVYFFLPVTITVLLLYSILSEKFRSKAGKVRWILYLLGAAYLTNFPRLLVRHSLAEGPSKVYMIWTGYLFIALFIGCAAGKKAFIPAAASIMLLNSLFVTDNNFISSNITENALAKTNTVDTWKRSRNSADTPTQWENYKSLGKPVQRVITHQNIAEYIDPLKEITELLLTDGETFLDFSNRTFVYSALQRECPVYVSQSPLQLSGEYSQERFIDEIKSDFSNIPIAIMPAAQNRASAYLDGILNSYRYYKVSEFIYQNYVPLCRAGDNAVWCDKDKYDHYLHILGESAAMTDIFPSESPQMSNGDMEISQPVARSVLSAVEKDTVSPDLTDIASDNGSSIIRISDSYIPDDFHYYNLLELPIIWAESGDPAVNNSIVSDVVYSGGVYKITSASDIDKTDGNYIKLSAFSEGGQTSAVLKLGTEENGSFSEKCSFEFTILEGTHDYIFRVSSDYNWYCCDLDTISIECEQPLSSVRMEVLRGD